MKTVLFSLSLFVLILSACNPRNVKEPEYRDVRNIHMVEVGPLQSTAGVDVIYYNPNNFGVQVAMASGDIYVDDIFFGKFELNDKVQVKKRSEFTLPALVKIDMIALLKNQRDLLKKKEVLVRIEGSATLRKTGFSRELPIKYESKQDVEKFKSLVGGALIVPPRSR